MPRFKINEGTGEVTYWSLTSQEWITEHCLGMDYMDFLSLPRNQYLQVAKLRDKFRLVGNEIQTEVTQGEKV